MNEKHFELTEEFEKQAERTHGDNQHGKVYKSIINVIKIKFNL